MACFLLPYGLPCFSCPSWVLSQPTTLFTCLSSGVRIGTSSTRFACLYSMAVLSPFLCQDTTCLTTSIPNKQKTSVSKILILSRPFLFLVDAGLRPCTQCTSPTANLPPQCALQRFGIAGTSWTVSCSSGMLFYPETRMTSCISPPKPVLTDQL